MFEFIRSFFGWHDIINSLIWALLTCATMRALLKWLVRKTLDRRQEIAFWMLAPATLLLLWAGIIGARMERPALSARIDGILIADSIHMSPQPKIDGAFVMLIANVKNSRMPSIVDIWRLYANLQDGTRREAKPFHFTHPFAVKDIDGKNVVFNPTQSLLIKTVTPIPTGGMAKGFVVFVFEHLRKEFFSPGTLFTLTYEDIEGREYTTEYKLSGQQSEVKFYPGMELEYEEPPAHE